VGGSVQLAAALLTCILAVLSVVVQGTDHRFLMIFTRLINILIQLLQLSLLMWTIVGAVWTFSVRSNVQHTVSDSSSYCQSTLYNFAYWLIIIQFFFIGLTWFCMCYKGLRGKPDV
jgi:hypothetical protein